MATNLIQNAGQNQYLNPQINNSPKTDNAIVENQNLKAAETDLNQQAAERVQQAFKLSISKEGAEMSKANDNIDKENEKQDSLKPAQTQMTPQTEQETSQIVNIVA